MMPYPGQKRTWRLALGLLLASAVPVPASAWDEGPAAARRLYHRSKNFKIPFNVDPAEKARLHEIQLWWSADQGQTWDLYSRVDRNAPSFSVKAPHDGEFWFAVRTQDSRGYLYPAASQGVEPGLKVVVDTSQPTMDLALKSRRGGQIRLRYEASDPDLDLSKLRIEYQAEGASTWRTVPIARPAESGEVAWNASTAATLIVRGTAVDRAGNVRHTELEVAEGTPDPDSFAGDDRMDAPAPPVGPIDRASNRRPARQARPAPAPALDEPPMLDAGDDEVTTSTSRNEAEPGDLSAQTPRLTLGTTRFPLKYAIDNAGPGGAAQVELYMTRDDGRTWTYLARDPDNVSPFQVELPGDGLFGLRLVARSASGFGDLPPQKGDTPETYVEVDTTPPTVQMGLPQLVQGASSPTLKITWRAEDPHLGPKPVVLSFRPDTPDSIWQQFATVPNTGQYQWKMPANLPGRIHLKVDVIDTLNNRAAAETPEDRAFVVDRSRPKGRIIGLDPGASPRMGSGAAWGENPR